MTTSVRFTVISQIEQVAEEQKVKLPPLTDEIVRIYAHEWTYSSARAEAELGYRITPLREGVAKTVAWLREHGALTPRSPGGP